MGNFLNVLVLMNVNLIDAMLCTSLLRECCGNLMDSNDYGYISAIYSNVL